MYFRYCISSISPNIRCLEASTKPDHYSRNMILTVERDVNSIHFNHMKVTNVILKLENNIGFIEEKAHTFAVN